MQDREWPSSTPCCVWSKKEALGQICMSPSREEGRVLLCCSPAGITPGSNPCNSRWPHNPAAHGGFKVGDGCLEIMCKYANYFIMLLAWNGTEQIKAWQLQKWEKWKGVQRGMLSFLILFLPSVWTNEVGKKTQGWPGKAWHLHLAFHGYLHCAWLTRILWLECVNVPSGICAVFAVHMDPSSPCPGNPKW